VGAGLRKTLRLLYYMGEIMKAYIDPKKCVGCGACIAECPEPAPMITASASWNTLRSFLNFIFVVPGCAVDNILHFGFLLHNFVCFL